MKNPALAPAVPVEGLNLRDVSRFLHGFRESLWLPPVESFESNFRFDDPVLEALHVLRNALDDAYDELEVSRRWSGLVNSPSRLIRAADKSFYFPPRNNLR